MLFCSRIPPLPMKIGNWSTELSQKPLDTGRDPIPLAVEGHDLKNSFRPGICGYGEGKRRFHGFITPWGQWECREGYQGWLNINNKLYLHWIFTYLHIWGWRAALAQLWSHGFCDPGIWDSEGSLGNIFPSGSLAPRQLCHIILSRNISGSVV